MSKSKRHHFIPVFYLKHFTNYDGHFYIYDVRNNEFKNNCQRFAPRTHFYEWQGNTVFYGSEPSEFIEDSFTNWDNNVAKIYNKFASNEHDSVISLKEEDWMMLQYFVNILYWRNPSNTDKVKDYIKSALNIKNFGIKLMDETTGNRVGIEEETKFFEKLKADTDFYKILRFSLPMITFHEIFSKDKNDFAHIFSFPVELPKIVSDNPIIFRNLKGKSLHTDEFIFPLTPTKILIRNHMKGLLIPRKVRVLIDMMLLMQAREYISCTDLRYPELLKTKFNESFTSIEHLRERIFLNILPRIG